MARFIGEAVVLVCVVYAGYRLARCYIYSKIKYNDMRRRAERAERAQGKTV